MQGQVEELLDLTRLEVGQQIELQRGPTDLVALAHQAANVQLFTKRHRIRVESPLAELVGAWDATRLARVIESLLSNAIKYSPPGSEIVVPIAQKDDTAVLTVRDQGIGIAQSDQVCSSLDEELHRQEGEHRPSVRYANRMERLSHVWNNGCPSTPPSRQTLGSVQRLATSGAHTPPPFVRPLNAGVRARPVGFERLRPSSASEARPPAR